MERRSTSGRGPRIDSGAPSEPRTPTAASWSSARRTGMRKHPLAGQPKQHDDDQELDKGQPKPEPETRRVVSMSVKFHPDHGARREPNRKRFRPQKQSRRAVGERGIYPSRTRPSHCLRQTKVIREA